MRSRGAPAPQASSGAGRWAGACVSLPLPLCPLSPPTRPRQSPGRAQLHARGWGWSGPCAGYASRGGTRRPALSRALAAGTVLQWAIGALEYCFCCPGKAGTPARAHPLGKSQSSARRVRPSSETRERRVFPPSNLCPPLNV